MPTLKLTDGTTTVDFGNILTGNYPLQMGGYVPKVNGLRAAAIGGRGIYEEVEETITFDVVDTTAGGCYSRLNTLSKLLLQATRFARGEAVAPVKLQYSPDGATVSSSGSPLEALVVGCPDSNPAGVGLAPTIDQTGYKFRIEDVSITIIRGVWLQGSETKTVTGNTNGQIASFTFTNNLDYLSPTDVTLAATVNGYTSPLMMFVLGSGSNSIQVGAIASTGTPPGDPQYTYVNDSANISRVTNVLRMTPTDTVERWCQAITYGTFTAGKRYAVLLSCRNNSSTTSFGVRMGVQYKANHILPVAYSEQRIIKPYSGSAAPGYVSLGTFVAPLASTNDAALILMVTASAASGSIDFDTIALVEIDTASVVQFRNPTKFPYGTYKLETTYIENQYLTALTMRVRGVDTLATEYIEVRNGGDVLSSGTAVKALFLGTEGTYWAQGTGGTPYTMDITLVRTRVHISPE